MFETASYLFLQQYWWAIIAILGAILVFLMFVQGGQTLIFSIGKTDVQRTMLVNTLGRKWEFTFTTLVTFGGAFFASFPLFYSTSFSGAYWVWFLVLFAFVFQAIAYEFRSRPNNLFGARTYEMFLFFNGLLGTILIGTAVGTFFTGSEFVINDLNQSFWNSPFRGVEAAFNLHNLMLGLTVFFLSRVLGILYFLNSIDDEEIHINSIKALWYNAIPFVVCFLTFTIWLLLRDGFAYDVTTKQVAMVPYKYALNLIEMPIVAVVFLLGVVGVLYGIYTALLLKKSNSIWFAGAGTILTVFALFLIAGYNGTAFYPSTADLQSSLTIENASSSRFTLVVMSYVSLFIPVVALYIWFAWKAINKKPITKEEMDSTEIHIY